VPPDKTAPGAASSPPNEQSQEQRMNAMIAALWVRSKDTVAERAQMLQSAGELWNDNRLDAATKLRAVDSAHKLAGVLGTFGLPRGTDLAREAEVLFGQSTPPGKAEMERLQVLLAELTRLIDHGPNPTV
jgi:HPt (histidine-containing phosphotransfer) domain-containing protein